MTDFGLSRGDTVRIDGETLTFHSYVSESRLLLLKVTTRAEVIVDAADFERKFARGEAGIVRRAAANPNTRHPSRASSPPPQGSSDAAKTLAYYSLAFDASTATLSAKSLDRLVDETHAKAVAAGHAWKPSSGALRRAINKTRPGDRQARFFERLAPAGNATKLPPPVARVVGLAVDYYYGAVRRTVGQAHVRAARGVRLLNHRRRSAGLSTFAVPSFETVRAHVKRAENHDNWCRRYGKDAARRRFRGTGRGCVADRILEYVMIDATVVDTWVWDDVLDVALGRPTLTAAIDVHSRMPLALVLSFEPPCLATSARALYEINRPKHDWAERYPGVTRPFDGWGKPACVIVDNSWEQVGKSFKDACLEIGTDVEWAPIATPEYKAIVERFFGTLNALLFHRLRGGVPGPPHVLKALGIDPAKEAVCTLDELETALHVAVAEIYQTRVHAGIGAAPALAWAKSKRAHGRPCIDDLELLRTVVGGAEDVVVRRDGVRLKGMRFHDPDEVSALLNDLASLEPVRGRAKGGAKAHAKAKFDAADCGRVRVWNEVRKSYHTLPNVDRRFSEGTPYRTVELVKAYAKQENLAFQSEAEKLDAHQKYRLLVEALSRGRYAQVRKARRVLNPPRRLEGGGVESVTEAAGDAPSDSVPHAPGALLRTDGGRLTKGPRRGGRKPARATKVVVAPVVGDAKAATNPAATQGGTDAPTGRLAGIDLGALRALDWVSGNAGKGAEGSR